MGTRHMQSVINKTGEHWKRIYNDDGSNEQIKL